MRQRSRWPASEITLLDSPKEWAGLLLVALLVGLLSWGFEYHAFKKLREEPKNRLQAQVLLQYTKKDEKGERIVLKLRTQEGVQFYTTTKEPLQDLTFRYVSLTILPQKITFWTILKAFMPPRIGSSCALSVTLEGL